MQNYFQPDSQPHNAASGAVPAGTSIGIAPVPSNFLRVGPAPVAHATEPTTGKDVPNGYETPSRR